MTHFGKSTNFALRHSKYLQEPTSIQTISIDLELDLDPPAAGDECSEGGGDAVVLPSTTFFFFPFAETATT